MRADDHPTPGASGTAGATAAEGADHAVLKWLVAATFIVILNETVMINAIPRLMADLDVDAVAAQWLSTAFMLTMAVVIPVTGWFLQRVTTRRAFGLAMATFCAGTLLAALAPGFAVLLVARVVQAAGTAVMLPLLMTTLMAVVAEHDRGRVMGNVTLAMSVAPAMGPAVSGVVLQQLSWRWIFWLVLPVAAAIGIVGLQRLRDVGEPVAGRLDVPSVVVAALGFGGLVYGLSEVGATGDRTPAYVALVVGALGVAVFVARQRRLQREDRPLLDLRTLRVRTYRLALVAMSLAFMAMLGAMILLPLHLQEQRGLEPLATGLLVMPGGILMGLLGPTVGRVFDRHGARVLVVPGAVAVTVAMAALAVLVEAGPTWSLLVAHVVLMVGLAAMFTPLFTIGLGSLPMRLHSHGSSLLGTLQQVAGAMGTAIAVMVMTSRAAQLVAGGTSPDVAAVAGLQWAFAVSAVLCLVVVVVVALLPARADGPAEEPSDGPTDGAEPGDALVAPSAG